MDELEIYEHERLAAGGMGPEEGGGGRSESRVREYGWRRLDGDLGKMMMTDEDRWRAFSILPISSSADTGHGDSRHPNSTAIGRRRRSTIPTFIRPLRVLFIYTPIVYSVAHTTTSTTAKGSSALTLAGAALVLASLLIHLTREDFWHLLTDMRGCYYAFAILDFLIIWGFLGSRKNALVVASSNTGRVSLGVADMFILTKTGEIPAVDLSPAAFALMKDHGNVRALLTMGQALLQNNQFAEAALLEAGYPTETEQVNLLIHSSIWAVIANVRQPLKMNENDEDPNFPRIACYNMCSVFILLQQNRFPFHLGIFLVAPIALESVNEDFEVGKGGEGLLHLERIAQLEEPEHPKSKAHYNEGLLVLSGVQLDCWYKAIVYDPAYSMYLEKFECDPNNIASDLVINRGEL
ncbi:membrane insertion protein [Striga asiatica]|uniref:Membrane insertion protein n=1 Tax=Striga asiatica TaxID=4170 RepID=A0A5A7R8A7_STRAF|nr:membrane insertion protein [Striga asiatica]